MSIDHCYPGLKKISRKLMMYGFSMLLTCLVFVTAPPLTNASASNTKHDAWSLEIIIPRALPGKTVVLNSQTGFQVKLKNISGKPLNIWKESNSWGYAMLGLLLTDSSGRSITLTRKEKSWRKNFPSAMEIGPGEDYSWNTNLSDKIWDGVSKLQHNGNYRLQAVLVIPHDDKTSKFNVWTGRVTSAAVGIKYQVK